jgi:SAM-dependent methyltransferase
MEEGSRRGLSPRRPAAKNAASWRGESFHQRSTRTEIIDDMALDPREMERVCRDLGVINTWLGGHATSLAAVRRLLPPGDGPVRVLDVGAGGGDTARALIDGGRALGRRIEVVSVDLSAAAVEFARDRLAGRPEACFVQADVLALPFGPCSFDVAHCSLFLHHFGGEPAAKLLRAMYAVSRYGVVVNDLHRHPLAYAGIWALTRLFPASEIVRHDGPLSVLRAFRREDLDELARATKLPMEVRWRWAFRYEILIRRPEAYARV